MLHKYLMETNSTVHIIAAGCGTALVREIMATPGSSKYLSGIDLPSDYATSSRLVGRELTKAVTQEAANSFAERAYFEACMSLKEGTSPIGIGITASLPSKKESRSPRQVFFTVIKPDGCRYHKTDYHTQLLGARPIYEESVPFLLHSMLEWQPDAKQHALTKNQFGLSYCHPEDTLIFPGTFDPFHEGHMGIVNHLEQEVSLQIEMYPTHKTNVSVPEFLGRLASIRKGGFLGLVEVTHGQPLYIDKALRNPERTFIIGQDAFERISSEDLRLMRKLHCHILVAPRVGYDRTYPCGSYEHLDMQPSSASSTQVRSES